MEILIAVAALVAVTALAGLIMVAIAHSRRGIRLNELEVLCASQSVKLSTLERDDAELRALREQASVLIEQKSTAITEKAETEKKLQVAISERNQALAQKDMAWEAQGKAAQNLAVAQQQLKDSEIRIKDWELQREEGLKASKASVMEAGNQLSSKLLEDHKREREAALKEAEEAAKKNAETFLEKVDSLTKSVAAINEQTSQTQGKMATVWRALTTPAAVGQLAEIGLENSLKNLGLEAPRDYITQFNVEGEGSRLRPDAVVFLPQDMVMVIDSKASKFVLEIAEAEARGESEMQFLQGLAKTMNDHLKALISKDYADAVRSAYRAAGRIGTITFTPTVMYVPSEAAITHIRRADPSIMEKAQKHNIIIASPASLHGLLSLARYNIGMQRQSENHEQIVSTVQQLMDSIITMMMHTDKIGKGIKAAADGFEGFASSANRNVLSKMRRLVAAGVRPGKGKEIPARIKSVEVRLHDDALTIDGDAEAVSETGAVEDLSKTLDAA